VASRDRTGTLRIEAFHSNSHHSEGLPIPIFFASHALSQSVRLTPICFLFYISLYRTHWDK